MRVDIWTMSRGHFCWWSDVLFSRTKASKVLKQEPNWDLEKAERRLESRLGSSRSVACRQRLSFTTQLLVPWQAWQWAARGAEWELRSLLRRGQCLEHACYSILSRFLSWPSVVYQDMRTPRSVQSVMWVLNIWTLTSSSLWKILSVVMTPNGFGVITWIVHHCTLE